MSDMHYGTSILEWLETSGKDDWGRLIGYRIVGMREGTWMIEGVALGSIQVRAKESGQTDSVSWAELRRLQIERPIKTSPPSTTILRRITEAAPSVSKRFDVHFSANTKAAIQRLCAIGLSMERFHKEAEIEEVDKIFAAERAGGRLSDSARAKIYDLFKSKCYKAKWESSVCAELSPHFRRWLMQVEGSTQRYHPVARLQLSVILRHQGDLEGSLKVSSIAGHLKAGNASDRSVLSQMCNNRAATLMDMFESSSELHCLQEAKRYLDKAWANEKAREISASYERWRRLSE